VNFGWARERRGSACTEAEIDTAEMFPPFIETIRPLNERRCAWRESR
jgi:hypothetical protein